MSSQTQFPVRVLCISGDAASGKTTAAHRVLELLGEPWRIVSTGGRFRQFCAERGIDPQQISHLDDDFHREADAAMLELLRSEHALIAEARLVGYLARDLPDALRVFCTCPLEVRALRFKEREPGFTTAEALRRVTERDAADTEKFRRLYGIDYHDPAYYQLTVDTHQLNPREVAEAILAAMDRLG
jgi:predicted cytidylate kinase